MILWLSSQNCLLFVFILLHFPFNFLYKCALSKRADGFLVAIVIFVTRFPWHTPDGTLVKGHSCMTIQLPQGC